jgi:hypothetical protein
MKSNLLLLVVCVFSIAVFTTGLFFTTAQTQISDGDKGRKHKLPQVDFPLENQQNVTEIDYERKKKNAGYDKHKWVRDPNGLDITTVTRKNHWYSGFPAIPTAKSALVISGKVTEAKAFLSNDKTGVYSEFNINVEKIIKNNDKSPISIGETIQVERSGGQVRFPSGQIVKFIIDGQGLPEKEKNYIFFLSYDSQRQSYRILTAYKISAGKIYALDGKNARGGGEVKFPMDEFNEYEESLFIDKVIESLSNPIIEERKVSTQ